MVAERVGRRRNNRRSCSLAKISMVAELSLLIFLSQQCCSLAKISMVAELGKAHEYEDKCCSLAKISMVAELLNLYNSVP